VTVDADDAWYHGPPLPKCPNRPVRGWCSDGFIRDDPTDRNRITGTRAECPLCHGTGRVPRHMVQQLEGRRWDG
jgi:hypothetical protein